MLLSPLKTCPFSHRILVIFAIAILYFVIGKFSLLLAMPETNASPIWPAAGLALAAVMLCSYAAMTGIFLGSALLNITAILSLGPGDGLLTALFVGCLTGLGAALQAGAGAALVHFFIPLNSTFKRATCVIKFLGIVMVSALINSTIGVLALLLTDIIPGHSFFAVWSTWWVGDTSGIFVITPLLLAWFKSYSEPWFASSILETIWWLIVVALTTACIYFIDPLFLYLLLPCLIWTAVRFNFAGATAATLFIVIIVTLMTINDVGPFVKDSLNASLIHLELFIMVATGTVLALAAEFDRTKTVAKVWQSSPKTLPRYTVHLTNRIKLYWRNRFKPKD